MKINIHNPDKIYPTLTKVNGLAASFTLRKAQTVQNAAEMAEAQLSALPKSERVGAVAFYTPAGPGAKAYKYAARSTRITLERFPTGWFLIGVERYEVYPRQPERLTIKISAEQRDEIARRATEKFVVDDDEPKGERPMNLIQEYADATGMPDWAEGLRSLPPHMIDGMVRYLVQGIPPGSFLNAVLSNDLMGALRKADDANRNALWAYGNFLYNCAPSDAYGSPERVAEWRGILDKQESDNE